MYSSIAADIHVVIGSERWKMDQPVVLPGDRFKPLGRVEKVVDGEK
jgi:hypothetical protein